MMAGLSIWHVIIFLVVVVLLFGTSKLKNLGKDVGGAVKDFKKSMRENEAIDALEPPHAHQHTQDQTPKQATNQHSQS